MLYIFCINLHQLLSFVDPPLRKFLMNVKYGVKEWGSWTNNFDERFIQILSKFENFIVSTVKIYVLILSTFLRMRVLHLSKVYFEKDEKGGRQTFLDVF